MKKTLMAFTVVGLALTGCSGDSGGDDSQTLKIAYKKTDPVLESLMENTKEQFEAANEGVTVELSPIEGNDEDYATKLALSQRSPDTAPDVFVEDSFKLRADVDAGYVLALDEYLADWEDWDTFNETAKQAGVGDDEGGTYAVPLETDTRVIWYNQNVLGAAGIESPWQPETWDDLLEMARTVKDSNPDVVPFSMYAGTMQSFYELLYGTEDGALYDEDEQKWVTGSQGFVDSLEFLKTIYDEGLAVTPAQALDPNIWQEIVGEMLPQDKMGATVEGSYAPQFWQEGADYEWPEYSEVMATAPFPTQDGQDPGAVSMSGGWTLAVGAGSANPDLAVEFLKTAMNKDNSLAYTVEASKIAVRTDVAETSEYQEMNPFAGEVTEVLDVSNYRPATADFAEIDTAVLTATQEVVAGGKSPEEAAATYDETLKRIVGEDNVVEK
ncbi:extracellular solute-binding protein [Arthrobacter yangruifuii]|uniref:Extracellular solute-binding protein n=1 Tax=Arthrobacter yangruifuii TaxID=2606616 RepID=A0A5N6MHZ6_9MICC|nr:extracellular solute-binding protein [Arthrobacter yangruifuii]KAD3633142.1 extracellular solute-binding protein [Arthrobacter yangruifuii]